MVRFWEGFFCHQKTVVFPGGFLASRIPNCQTNQHGKIPDVCSVSRGLFRKSCFKRKGAGWKTCSKTPILNRLSIIMVWFFEILSDDHQITNLSKAILLMCSALWRSPPRLECRKPRKSIIRYITIPVTQCMLYTFTYICTKKYGIGMLNNWWSRDFRINSTWNSRWKLESKVRISQRLQAPSDVQLFWSWVMGPLPPPPAPPPPAMQRMSDQSLHLVVPFSHCRQFGRVATNQIQVFGVPPTLTKDTWHYCTLFRSTPLAWLL